MSQPPPPSRVRERIQIELSHPLPENPPEIAIASGVDVDALTAPDRESNREPMFITLYLGEVGQTSRNNRRYVGRTAVDAIYQAISEQRIGGNKGHTPSGQEGTYFDVPVLHWVGAIVQDGVVWGKAYVPGESERQREMRNYYQIQRATRSPVGTSLEGYGREEWNDDLALWDITDLTVHRIDAVEALLTGIPDAGKRPPHITSEMVNPGSLDVGDFVSWEEQGELNRGQVNTIWTDAEVDVPYSDATTLQATPDNPVARMDVYRANYETGNWVRTNQQIVRYFSQLVRLERLPEINQMTARQRELTDMTDTINLTEAQLQERIEAALQERTADLQQQLRDQRQQHAQALTEMQAERDDAQDMLRNANVTLTRLGNLLVLDADDSDSDVVQVLRDHLDEMQTLQAENARLLEHAIRAEVAAHVQLETMRPLVTRLVRAEKPATQAAVEEAVASVLTADDMKAALTATLQQETGPNVDSPWGDADDSETAGAVTY